MKKEENNYSDEIKTIIAKIAEYEREKENYRLLEIRERKLYKRFKKYQFLEMGSLFMLFVFALYPILTFLTGVTVFPMFLWLIFFGVVFTKEFSIRKKKISKKGMRVSEKRKRQERRLKKLAKELIHMYEDCKAIVNYQRQNDSKRKVVATRKKCCSNNRLQTKGKSKVLTKVMKKAYN